MSHRIRASRKTLKPEARPVRIQSTHRHADRGLDPYWTPPEATRSLLALEAAHLPCHIWEPWASTRRYPRA
jgi:hypothetical protein